MTDTVETTSEVAPLIATDARGSGPIVLDRRARRVSRATPQNGGLLIELRGVEQRVLKLADQRFPQWRMSARMCLIRR